MLLLLAADSHFGFSLSLPTSPSLHVLIIVKTNPPPSAVLVHCTFPIFPAQFNALTPLSSSQHKTIGHGEKDRFGEYKQTKIHTTAETRRTEKRREEGGVKGRRENGEMNRFGICRRAG
jgi:hypothetical protein